MTGELTMLLDHVALSVGDLGAASRFYEASLAPLGLSVVRAQPPDAHPGGQVGFGIGRKGQFWLVAKGLQQPPGHIAFRAGSRAAVHAFHRAALAHGGSDNGAPGIQQAYHPAYYAAFVRDPEGHNVEAVTFAPESGPQT